MMEPFYQLILSVSATLIAACAVYIAKSLNDLNIKIAVVVEKVDTHERRITKLEGV